MAEPYGKAIWQSHMAAAAAAAAAAATYVCQLKHKKNSEILTLKK